MTDYEYKTVPVPQRPKKIRGIRGPGPQAAATFGALITAEAVDGWRYVGMELVPIQQGGGLFSRPHTVEQGVLVFERTAQKGGQAAGHETQMGVPQVKTQAEPPLMANTSPPITPEPAVAPRRVEPVNSLIPEDPPELGGAQKR